MDDVDLNRYICEYLDAGELPETIAAELDVPVERVRSIAAAIELTRLTETWPD